RDDHLLGAAVVDVHAGFGRIGEESGRLDDDVHAEVFPGQLGGVSVAHELHAAAADDDVVPLHRHGRAKSTQRGVVLQEMGERVRVADVVDGDDIERRFEGVGGTVDVPADAPETIDSNPGHQ